jgi:uncharacterized protein (UPF0261 family)
MNTLMRTNIDENKQLGKWIAEKLNRAKGSVSFIIPKRGISYLDTEGQPFYDPIADAALFDAFKSEANQNMNIIEMDTNINDEQFAIKAANLLIESLNKSLQLDYKIGEDIYAI